MQIFVTNSSPLISAHNLWANPTRAMKMITESQQILACAAVLRGYGGLTLLKVDGTPFATPKSRMNHPVVKWAGESDANFKWLGRHLIALHNIYRSKGGDKFRNVPENINRLALLIASLGCVGDPTKFLNFAKADAKGLNFTHVADVFEAYRLFLDAQK